MKFQVDMFDPNKQAEAEIEVWRRLAEKMYNMERGFGSANPNSIPWKTSATDPMQAGAAKIEALRLFAHAAVGDEIPAEYAPPPDIQAKVIKDGVVEEIEPVEPSEKETAAAIERDSDDAVTVKEVTEDTATLESTDDHELIMEEDGSVTVAPTDSETDILQKPDAGNPNSSPYSNHKLDV